MAHQAFERVLQLDAENVDAMAGLAVCELSVAAASASSELRADATKRASKLLARVCLVLDRYIYIHKWPKWR